ncbi:MAG: Bax inhibitor-1 family protein [Bdellovibrionota bacterium]
MDILFASLVSKTLFIVGTQILLTFFATAFLIGVFRRMYLEKRPGITATTNEDGELDLDISWDMLRGPFFALLAADIATFLILLFWGTEHAQAGFLLFCFWSILTGFELALALLSIDENLGLRAMRITALVTLSAALIGMYSGINFASLGGFLFVALSGLVLFDFFRMFYAFSNRTQLVGAIIGALIFTAYLVFDFNRLENMGKSGSGNTWERAMNLSISIYLDIINLFLKILNILASSKHH